MYRHILISIFTLYLLTLSVQAGHSALSIVLSTEEVKTIGKEYDASVAKQVQTIASSPSAPLAPTTPQDSAAPNVDSKVNGWKISARPLYNATLEALTSYPQKFAGEPHIVLFVGVTANGGYGIGAAEIFAANGYLVTLVVIPRYKSEVLREEAADSVWEDHLRNVLNKYPSKITKQDFREEAASKAATHAITAYRKQLMKDHKNILQNKDIAFKDQVTTVQELPESSIAKGLKNSLDALLLAEKDVLEAFLRKLNLKNCVAIDAIVTSGFETKEEIVKKYVIRYNLAQAVNRYFNARQRSGVVTGSFDSQSNTTTERGYYHVTTDATMAVTIIPDSHIPNFIVFITYPREAVMALEAVDPPKPGTAGPPADHVDGPSSAVQGVDYQYRRTKMFLTIYADPNYPTFSMADCIEEVAKKRNLNANDEATLTTFKNVQKAAEMEYVKSEYKSGGFLQVNLPNPVTASEAYIAGFAQLTKVTTELPKVSSDTSDKDKVIKVTKVTTVPTYLSFTDYASKFAAKGNRRHPKEL